LASFTAKATRSQKQADDPPSRVSEHNDCYFPGRKILLIAYSLVSREQDVKPGSFGRF
jgi:hypothetical protein